MNPESCTQGAASYLSKLQQFKLQTQFSTHEATVVGRWREIHDTMTADMTEKVGGVHPWLCCCLYLEHCGRKYSELGWRSRAAPPPPPSHHITPLMDQKILSHHQIKHWIWQFVLHIKYWECMLAISFDFEPRERESYSGQIKLVVIHSLSYISHLIFTEK